MGRRRGWGACPLGAARHPCLVSTDHGVAVLRIPRSPTPSPADQLFTQGFTTMSDVFRSLGANGEEEEGGRGGLSNPES
ncbi:unnamed protein product [Boreogadus saida]